MDVVLEVVVKVLRGFFNTTGVFVGLLSVGFSGLFLLGYWDFGMAFFL